MAFSSYRTRFQGELANIKTEELKELDYSINAYSARKDFIDKKYHKVKDFYDAYIYTVESNSTCASLTEEDRTEFYKVNLNTTDELSANINIFRYLENDANYLLNSLDVPREKRQQQYNFLTEEEFRKVLYKERKNISLDSPEVLTIAKPKQENFYKCNDIVIKQSDFKDEELAETILPYEEARTILIEEMQKIKAKEESRFDLGFLKRNLGSIKGDMVDCKRILKGVRCPAKRLGDESGMFYEELIDYTNEKHIKAILKGIKITGELEPDSDLSHIAYDMERAIAILHANKKLDELDLEIIECYNSGYSERAIAQELGKGSTTIQQRMAKIVKRIATFYKNTNNK